MNRYFILAMIFPSMLAGCVTPAVTATLTTTPPAAEEEIRGGMAPGSKGVVTNNKPSQGGRASEPGREGTNESAGGSGTAGTATASGTTGSGATPGAGAASGGGDTNHSSNPLDPTNGDPYLDIQEGPRQNFSIIPVRAADDTVADLKFNAEDPLAQWKVAYAGGKATMISTIRLTYQGNGEPWSVELTPDEMEWPKTLGSGSQSLDLGLDIGATFSFFEAQPDPGERLTITVSLLDAQNVPLKDAFGEDAELRLLVSVL